MIRAYTDGGFKKEPATCSYGVYIVPEVLIETKEGVYKYGLVDYEKLTSQISEMWACKIALETLLEYDFNNDEIVLYSDSQYCINTMSKWYNSWVKKGTLDSKANIELWHEIMHMVKKFKNIKFEWVRGHNGDIHNELVDGINQVAIGRITIDKVLKKFKGA